MNTVDVNKRHEQIITLHTCVSCSERSSNISTMLISVIFANNIFVQYRCVYFMVYLTPCLASYSSLKFETIYLSWAKSIYVNSCFLSVCLGKPQNMFVFLMVGLPVGFKKIHDSPLCLRNSYIIAILTLTPCF